MPFFNKNERTSAIKAKTILIAKAAWKPSNVALIAPLLYCNGKVLSIDFAGILLVGVVVKTETKMAVPIDDKACLKVLLTAVPCEILSSGREFIPEVVSSS